MAGRGATTFQKRQKEQQRKEKQQLKFEKRLERKKNGPASDEAGEQTEEATIAQDAAEPNLSGDAHAS